MEPNSQPQQDRNVSPRLPITLANARLPQVTPLEKQAAPDASPELPPSNQIPISVLDGVTRTASTSFQQLTGNALQSLQGATVCTVAVEITRAAIGLMRGALRGTRPSTTQIKLMSIWAVNASAMTVGHTIAYRMGADQGVANMLVMASVIPGLVIDSVAFKDRLTKTKLAACVLLLGGCYVALGAPGLAVGATLGSWVAIKLGIACGLAVNEGVRRRMVLISESDPQKHSVSSAQAMLWVGGISVALLAPVGIATGGFTNILSYSSNFWIGTAGMAASVVASTALSLAVYAGGGSIVARKIVTTTTTIVGTIAAGTMLFGEALTGYKIAGALMVLGASLLLTLKGKAR